MSPNSAVSIPEVLSESSRKRMEAKAERRRRHFIKGPLPLGWFEAALRLPGKSANVALALWYRAGLTRSLEISLSNVLLRTFSVHRDAKHRALQHLEAAGLVAVSRRRGRSVCVRLTGMPNGWAEQYFRRTPRASSA